MSNDKKDSKKGQPVFTTAEIPQHRLDQLGLQKSDAEDGLAYFIEEGKTEKKVVAPKISLSEDRVGSQHFAGVFKVKSNLLPSWALKQIRVQDSLVASILRARGNTMSLHGHVRRDRFDVGIEVIIKPEFKDAIKAEQLPMIQERISKFETLLVNCGHVEGLKHEDRLSLSEFLDVQARNGLTFGMYATEIVHSVDNKGNRKFHRFRPVDSGTIYKTVDDSGDGVDSLRAATISDLKESFRKNNIKFDEKVLDAFKQENYVWAQVVNGTPEKAFASDELVVQNLYPSTDIEHNGYPVTPLDTCMSSVVSHISIDTYNRLYFQNGRAAKGMLVVKSDAMDQDVIENIKAQFYASINTVSNSFRAPIFGINTGDEVSWQPMVSSTGDGEFQFLYDSVARNILSAFNMSPDELPGYGHLSRGTNQKTMSESSNEFKLTASRDTGLRPLVLKFQAFFNEYLFPIIDPELSRICSVQFSGLDAKNEEEQSLRLQQDSPLFMTYDDVLEEVDKQPIGKRLGGTLPFNERWNIAIDKYVDVSEVKGSFLDDPASFVDPISKYKRDAFWMQYVQFLGQVNPEAVKAKFTTPAHSIEILKMLIQDSLEEDEE